MFLNMLNKLRGKKLSAVCVLRTWTKPFQCQAALDQTPKCSSIKTQVSSKFALILLFAWSLSNTKFVPLGRSFRMHNSVLLSKITCKKIFSSSLYPQKNEQDLLDENWRQNIEKIEAKSAWLKKSSERQGVIMPQTIANHPCSLPYKQPC